MHFISPKVSTGSFNDVEAMTEFAQQCDVLSLENEFIDSKVLKQVQENSGTPIYPSPERFAKIENKLIEKQSFENAGIPVTPYKQINGEADLKDFGHQHGWPFVLKSSKGGYDGYGNATVSNVGEAVEMFSKLGGSDGHDIIAEAYIDFTHELAVQVAYNGREYAVYECCETVQSNHICVAVITPARVPDSIKKLAQKRALEAMKVIATRGIVAFEFFYTSTGQVLLNESAPRPHNSGHYSIEGCITSQFENHVRAVLGLDLGSTELSQAACVMINLLGTQNRKAQIEYSDELLSKPNGHLHMYGKIQSKIGRKMGHYTLLGDDIDSVYARAIEITQDLEI
jgi:5-(carboxyamino)imidazole ribonucleotide synthase